MIEIQQAIRDQLKAQGYTNAFSESIMEQLIDKIDDSRKILNWENIFKVHRGRFRTAASAVEVIERLREGDLKLGEQVAQVLEEEGQTLIDSPRDVKAWLKEVITANNLQGIVFIWDEFTEFFTNNVPVTPLQELAQATGDMPFYLLLVTHRALSQFTRIDDDTRKKLMDRFHPCHLEMTPVTAYKLIGNVIRAEPNFRHEWESKQDSLWSQVDVAMLHINILGEQVNKEELKLLPPIHPFSAYLLATISSLYSSSQRTFFQFLKKMEPGSFQWFIANYPRDGWYWLTPDYLWLYFFEETKIEDIEAISDLLSHYNSAKDRLTEEETRIFRIMMLLTALQRQTEGAHSLLRPNLSVIKRMFVGTTLYNRVEKIAEGLRSKDIMLAIPSGNDTEYIIPRVTIDHDKLRQYQQKAEASLTMEKMINVKKAEAEFAPKLKELFLLQGAAKLRHPIQIATVKELKNRREHVLQGVKKPYEIGVVLVVPQEDDKLVDSENIAKTLTREYPNYCILISQMSFGSKRWKDWIQFRARTWYYDEMRDNNMKKYCDTKANSIVTEWINTVRISKIRSFFRGKQEELSGFEGITSYLGGLVEIVFPYGPERIDKTATLYTNPWGKTGAEIGLQVAKSIQRPYKDVVDKLVKQRLWKESDLDHHTNHPVARLKRTVDELFADQSSVNISELWTAVQQPPYGLMPSPIGILLFSFLLNSYSTGYYYSDGVNSLALNPNKLAELIHEVLKNIGSSENYTIRKMSDEGEKFCLLAKEIFHLAPEQATYPEEARKNMIAAIIKLGYPLWTVIYYSTEAPHLNTTQQTRKAVAILNEALVYDRGELSDVEMKEIVDLVYPERHHLRQCLSRDRMQKGMQIFWSTHAPRLQVLRKKLGMGETEIMAQLRLLLNEDINMWCEKRVKDKLHTVIKNLDLIHAMNLLCGVKKHDLESIRNYFRGTWFTSKLPLTCFREGQPDNVVAMIDYINELIYYPAHVPEENRADDIRSLKQEITIAIKSDISITRKLIEKYAGQNISEQETKLLYESLPVLSGVPENEVREAILRALSQQSRQRKIAELKQKWEELTDSKSPISWSEENRTPIQWVLEGHAHHEFFTNYSNLQHLTESELDEAISHLLDYSTKFGVLLDREHVLDRFTEISAGDYANLVRQSGKMDDVRDYIYNAFNGNVYQWPLQLGQINQRVRQWVNDNYQSSAYPKLVEVIEKMSPTDIKDFIRDLVAKDALIGIRLLTAMQDGK
ncbi:MAG TPA: hypothetical protein GXZ55_04400 [Natronincola sp.]|nr:hypothetical protein [Natronincola sp.]